LPKTLEVSLLSGIAQRGVCGRHKDRCDGMDLTAGGPEGALAPVAALWTEQRVGYGNSRPVVEALHDTHTPAARAGIEARVGAEEAIGSFARWG
jgi:hypothetical protein